MPEEPTPTNAFVATLEAMEDGGIISDLDKRLRAVVQEARRLGKKASMSVVIGVEPRGADSMIVTADIGQKMPKADKQPAIFFDAEDGDLRREHPKQTTLPFAKAAQP